MAGKKFLLCKYVFLKTLFESFIITLAFFWSLLGDKSCISLLRRIPIFEEKNKPTFQKIVGKKM